MVDTWTVITTHNRHTELAALLSDIDPEFTIVVDNRSDPPVDVNVRGVIYADIEPNISRLWNLGLDDVTYLARGVHNVAILNDDLRMEPDLLPRLAGVLREQEAAIAFPDTHGILKPGEVDFLTQARPHNLFYRMTGFCFMLRGELNMRADESLVWWYGDDDLEWRAATNGGVARVGGGGLTHLHPNESVTVNAQLAEQAAKDRETFIAKWGQPPW